MEQANRTMRIGVGSGGPVGRVMRRCLRDVDASMNDVDAPMDHVDSPMDSHKSA